MEEQGIREGPPPSGDRIICRTSLITEHLHLLTSYSPQADLQGTVIPSLQIRKPRLIKDPYFAVKWHTVEIVKSQVL